MPTFELKDLLVILWAALSIGIIFIPCIPAVIIIALRKKSFKTGVKFPLKSCIISYGIVVMISLAILIPTSVVNTFLSPIWHASGHKELAVLFTGIENVFIHFAVAPIMLIVSILVPLRIGIAQKQTDNE